MAGTTYDALVRLLGDTSGFGNAMKKAQWDAATFGQKMQAIGGIMSNIGRDMTMYVTVPIVAGMALATKAAIDEEKEVALLAEAMRKNARATDESIASTESWITAQQNATGISDGELRPALAALVAATKDAGEAQDLLTAAMDISAAKGKPLEAVTAAIAKAYLGNVGALGRLGIATKNAKGETLTFEQVMKNAIATYGGAAGVAAETTAGKMAILRAKISDLVETVGGMLIPFVSKAVDLLTRMADWAGNLPTAWQQVGVAMAAAAAAAGPLIFVLGKIISIIGVIAGVAGGGWIAAIIAAIVAIAAALGTLYAKSETFRNFVNTVWGEFMSTVQAVVGIVKPLLQDLWNTIVAGIQWVKENVDWAGLWADIGPALAEVQAIVVNFTTLVVNAITDLVTFIRANWGTIGPIIKAAWDTGMAVTQTFFATVGPILGAIADILNGDFSAAWQHAKDAVQRMADGIGNIMDNLVILIGRLAVAAAKALWEAFKDGVEQSVGFVASLPGKAVTALASLAGKLMTVGAEGMAGLWDGLEDKWADVIGWVRDLPGKIKSAFGSAVSWLYNAGYQILSGLLNGIKAAWESVAEYLGSLAGKIKDLKGPLDKDRRLLVPEGKAIMEGLLAGIVSVQPALERTLAGVSSSIAPAIAAPQSLLVASSAPGSSALVINVDARGSVDPAAVEAAARRGAIIGYAEAKRATRRGAGR